MTAQSDIAYLMIPAVFGLIIFSRPIIETLFTKAYMDSAVFLKVYAFTYLVYIIPHDAIPRASGHSNWVLKIYLLLTPLSLIVVYFFAGKYGAMGALVSSMVFMFLPKIPGLMFSAEITGEKIYKLIAWKALGFYTLINCALALLTYSLKPFFLTEKIWFFTIAPLYAVVYLIVVNTVKYFKTKYEEKLCNINLEVSGPF
jgi:O-antigen/teichoic acid export membrane protein